MKSIFAGLLIAAAVLTLLAFWWGGIPLVQEGLHLTLETLLQATPLIIAAFLLIGQLQVVLTAEKINQLIQKFSGIKGILFSVLAGGLFPGPPYVYYPFISSFKDKPIPFYLFFAFLSGKHVYDVARIPMEISLINPGLALLRNLLTLPVPILMGLLSRYLFPHDHTNTYFHREEP